MRNRDSNEDSHTQYTTIDSKSLGSEVQISIHNTGGDDTEPTRDALFLLDGDAFFDYTTATLEYYMNSLRAPPLTVVGIEVEDRKTTFTPPTNQLTGLISPPLTRCLREEIIPYVDGLGNPTHHKTLLGHSLGGLYALTSMLEGDGLFNAWVAFSPSLTLHLEYLRSLLEAQRESIVGTLFLASDGDSPDDARFAHELVNSLDSRTHDHLRIRRLVYPEADHFTIFIKAFPDALDFLVPVLAHRHNKR